MRDFPRNSQQWFQIRTGNRSMRPRLYRMLTLPSTLLVWNGKA